MLMRKLGPGLIAAGLLLSSAAASVAADRNKPMPEKPYRVAQSADGSYRVNELEEQLRNLNGRVEELSFQLLQLQEELRKMKEDNEFRFQEIEEKRGDAGSNTEKEVAITDHNRAGRLEKSDPSGTTSENSRPDGKKIDEDTQKAVVSPPENPKVGDPPRKLGTLKFDEQGNVVGTGIDEPVDLTVPQTDAKSKNDAFVPFGKGTEGAVEASEFGATPNEVFAVGKTSYESRDYRKAEQAFRAHLAAWPKDSRHPEARYYLGQSLFWQKKYYNAANVFLDTHNAHPEASTAPDTLLALGLSLAGLNQREVACATYAEVLKQYPDAESRLGPQLKAEQESARC